MDCCFIFLKEPSSRPSSKKSVTPRKLDTLWIYGDSQAERLHLSIEGGPLCTKIFKSCNISKMWVYPYTSQVPPWDNKDYDDKLILDDLRKVLERQEMNENSVLILNLGLHYMESISLKNYQNLLDKVVDLLNERDSTTGELRHKSRVIWKTSTSLSKEKDTGGQLKSDRRRFLTLPVSKNTLKASTTSITTITLSNFFLRKLLLWSEWVSRVEWF